MAVIGPAYHYMFSSENEVKYIWPGFDVSACSLLTDSLLARCARANR